MVKKRLLPFGALPAHWGMAGKMRELAEAEYYLEGEELDRKKVEINIAEKSDDELKVALLEVERKYGNIDDETFDRKKAGMIEDEKERKIALLKIDHRYGKIDESELEKQTKTLLEEPFIRVAKLETDPKNPAYGGIIFDYNEAFVLYLEEHGYGPHPDQDDTVNEWFNELCKNIALEAFDGLGDFSERMAAGQQPRRGFSDDIVYKEPEDKDDDAGDLEE
jgi:hypothetical protein